MFTWFPPAVIFYFYKLLGTFLNLLFDQIIPGVRSMGPGLYYLKRITHDHWSAWKESPQRCHNLLKCSSKIYFGNRINFLHGHLTAPPPYKRQARSLSPPRTGPSRSPLVRGRLHQNTPMRAHHLPPNTALYKKFCPMPNLTLLLTLLQNVPTHVFQHRKCIYHIVLRHHCTGTKANI